MDTDEEYGAKRLHPIRVIRVLSVFIRVRLHPSSCLSS
jgi:hypothetical protein